MDVDNPYVQKQRPPPPTLSLTLTPLTWFRSAAYPHDLITRFLFRGEDHATRITQWCGVVPTASLQNWVPRARYNVGEKVMHQGVLYKCQVEHIAAGVPPPKDQELVPNFDGKPVRKWSEGNDKWHGYRLPLQHLDVTLAGTGATTLLVYHYTRPRGPFSLVQDASLEFALDLDLPDFDVKRLPGIRSSLVLGSTCSCIASAKKTCCQGCWVLVEIAAAIFRVLLGDIYAFGPMMPVFSGGKGLHLWFGSRRVRTELGPEHRSALAAEFTRWHERSTLDVLVKEMAHNGMVQRVVTTAVETWKTRAVAERQVLAQAHESGWWAQFLPPEGRGRLQDAWQAAGADSVARWAAFERVAQACHRPLATVRAILEACWPLPDISLYQPGGHVIKMPWSLHASGNGRIALPLDAAMLRECDPPRMPTVEHVAAKEPHALAWVERGKVVLRTWLDETDA